MISIIVVNYNSAKATDKLVEYLQKRILIPYKLTVVDNGSDTNKMSKYTTTRLETNRNKLGGVLTGLHLSAKYNPEFYWTISTSMDLDYFADPAQELIAELLSVRNAVAIIPGFTGEVQHKTHQAVKAFHNYPIPCHRVLMGVGPYALFDAAWLDSIGWFDPALTSSWGVDYELGYIAMKQNKVMLVSDNVTVAVDESGKYVDNLDAYQQECREEMTRVLSKKYGENWYEILRVEDQLCGI